MTARRSGWTFLALGDSRQFAGNDGYADQVTREYRFDSTYRSCRPAGRRSARVRNADEALGMGWVERLDHRAALKQRRRCPECGTTALKRRIQKRPFFRCGRGHETDAPAEETIEVVASAAHYGSTWWPLKGHLAVADLAWLPYHAKAQQHAIRSLSVDGSAGQNSNAEDLRCLGTGGTTGLLSRIDRTLRDRLRRGSDHAAVEGETTVTQRTVNTSRSASADEGAEIDQPQPELGRCRARN